jgi:hypothetical protein
MVSERVVDEFEPVEVEEEYSERNAGALPQSEGVLEPLEEELAVR